MRVLRLAALVPLVALMGWTPVERSSASAYTEPQTGQSGPALQSIGPLAFSPDGVLFAGDTQAAAIFAFELGAAATGGAPGAKSIPAIDQKIAAMLGTDAREIQVTDLAIHPKTRNAYLSVMRGQGAAAQPALLRVDGAGKIDLVSLQGLKFSKADLPNAPAANPGSQRNPRGQSITDMAFVDGRLYRRRSVERGVRVEAADRFRIRSRRWRMAPASRSTTAITASSRRDRPCTRSCRIASTTRRT